MLLVMQSLVPLCTFSAKVYLKPHRRYTGVESRSNSNICYAQRFSELKKPKSEPEDLRVAINIAVSEFARDGCKDIPRLLSELQRIRNALLARQDVLPKVATFMLSCYEF